MLAALGIRYGTDEGNDFSEKVPPYSGTHAYAYLWRCKERGAFEIFDIEREKNNPFINRLKELILSCMKIW
jgi:ribonucleoside-diphosphate reductase alpha chain